MQEASNCLKDAEDISTTHELTIEECYSRFCELQPNFAASYAAYRHYRKLSWIPKSGLKYGGDFVLYRKGPAHYHAE